MARRSVTPPSERRPARGERPGRSLALLGAAALLGASGARAETTFRLRYRAFEGCPDEAAFVAEVRRRTPAALVTSSDEGAARYDVDLAPDGETVRGTLRVEREGGGVFAREVRGDTCAQTMAALAFVAAVSLDPNAALAVPTPSLSASVQMPLAPAPQAPQAERPPPGSTPARSAPLRPQFAAGVDGVVTNTIAPALAGGAGVFVDASFPSLPTRPSLRLVGSFAVSGAAAPSDPSLDPGQKASFWLLSARLEGCAVGLELRALRLVPCLGYELGGLHAAGKGVDHPASETRIFSAGHAGGRAQARIAGGWFAELGGRLVVPFTSRSFFFEPHQEYFSLPRASFAGEAGFGVTFP